MRQFITLRLRFFLLLAIFSSLVAPALAQRQEVTRPRPGNLIRKPSTPGLSPRSLQIRPTDRPQSPLPSEIPADQLDPILAAVNRNSYRLGPGDVLEVSLIHRGPAIYTRHLVTPKGTIFVEPAGELKLDGMKLAEAEKALRRSMAQYLKGFSMELNLVRVRRYPVNVIGEVVNPGAYEANGVAGIAELIIKAGGLTEVGSLRRVQLVDKTTGSTIRTVDLLVWMESGEPRHNPTPGPGQVIVVPAVQDEIDLRGMVNKPGRYEILPGETLAQLTQLAGGPSSTARLDHVQVARLTPEGNRINTYVSLTEQGQGYALSPGDEVEYFDATLAQGRVVVVGELNGIELLPEKIPSQIGVHVRRTALKIGRGERVSDLVARLGGPTAKADLDHAFIERVGPEGERLVVPVNLRRVLVHQDSSQDVALLDGDFLMVPSIPENVFVTGFVMKPSVFAYTPGLTLREYLAMAGGTTDQAHTKHARLVRPVPGGPPLVYEFDLLAVVEDGAEPAFSIQAGDIIYVPLYKSLLSEALPILNSLYIFTLFR